MSNFSNGPFLEIVTEPRKPIGEIVCECGDRTIVKINASGWPYYFCSCGEFKTRSITGARRVVMKVVKFERGLKKKCLAAVANKPAPSRDTSDDETELEHVEPPETQYVRDDDHAQSKTTATDSDAKPDEKRGGLELTFFGKKIL